MAKALGSSVAVVYVLPAQEEHGGRHTTDALGWEVARLQARDHLERLQLEISSALGAPVGVRLEQGRPAERILDVARELSADIIVLGSGGRDAPDGVLGGTAQRVLAEARTSVLIAPPPSAQSAVPPRRILVPLDGSLRAESTLPTAARLAKAHAAELLLVHVVQEPHAVALLEGSGSVDLAHNLAASLESGAERYLAQIKERLAHDGVVASSLVVRHANERVCVLKVAQATHADLVLLSAHGASCDSGRTFGGVTGQLLSHSTIPLLVLQDLLDSDLPSRRGAEAVRASAPPSPRVAHASARP